ncbi:MAG TPA: SURF1 family protein [Azospirillaceae bacterium]|nr:SURF1 family protein [Azospirillaceae bacterium]
MTQTATPFRRFRPTLWFTVFAVFGVAALLALGTWQVQRLTWKNDLIARLEVRLAAPPEPLPARIDDPAAWEYRRASVAGRFLHDKEMLIAGRTWQGQAGWHVVTPLVRDDGAGAVLVNRGFVPHDRRDPALRREGQVADSVTVEGLVRPGGRQSWMQPGNRPGENTWFWYDIPAMAAHAGLKEAPPVVLEAGPAANPGGLPIGGQTVVRIRNDHLTYALTWYSLAVALGVIWFFYHWRRRPTGG